MSVVSSASVIEPVCSKAIETAGALDVFVHASPASTRENDQAQFSSMAMQAIKALADRGLGPESIVSGWIHFSKAPGWDWREALAQAWNTASPLPMTALVQPPAQPFCSCVMRLHAVRSVPQQGVWFGATAKPAAATVLRFGARHLRLMSVVPRAEVAARLSLVDQAYDMFAQAGHALTDRGLSFADVLRTWIHVRDIDANYAALNQARNRYYIEHGLARLPASTCVEGGILDGSAFGMDVYAVGATDTVSVAAVSPGSMSEAATYGASFARGSILGEPGSSTLYVSGTASIDHDGHVVAAGDLRGQLACMLGHVARLLEDAGMTPANVAYATLYLKDARALEESIKAVRAFGLSAEIPLTVVVASICRPAWLCEIELCAVRPDPVAVVVPRQPAG